jgi:DNA modification methylase
MGYRICWQKRISGEKGRRMSARWITADVFDGLATLETGSVDLVVTSPPFLALRSYLPADHPDKSKEIGSEATPAEFIDAMLRVTAELRRVLAPHGSICIELGDTYAGSVHSGDQDGNKRYPNGRGVPTGSYFRGGPGWPLAKSKTLIPELYRIALAYGINPLTGTESPAGQWRIRNVVTWARPNPPVGALGDKWRPATSDLVVACTSAKRYWDDLATRKPWAREYDDAAVRAGRKRQEKTDGSWSTLGDWPDRDPSVGAPLLDYWEIPPTGYAGSHYAVYPPALVEPCVKAMCPPKVCLTCGQPSRRIVSEATYQRTDTDRVPARLTMQDGVRPAPGVNQHLREDGANTSVIAHRDTLGWSDCGHDNYRPGLILDPFAGSGTTLLVATGYGHDAIGIDLDPRNADLALQRVGPFLLEVTTL